MDCPEICPIFFTPMCITLCVSTLKQVPWSHCLPAPLFLATARPVLVGLGQAEHCMPVLGGAEELGSGQVFAWAYPTPYGERGGIPLARGGAGKAGKCPASSPMCQPGTCKTPPLRWLAVEMDLEAHGLPMCVQLRCVGPAGGRVGRWLQQHSVWFLAKGGWLLWTPVREPIQQCCKSNKGFVRRGVWAPRGLPSAQGLLTSRRI